MQNQALSLVPGTQQPPGVCRLLSSSPSLPLATAFVVFSVSCSARHVLLLVRRSDAEDVALEVNGWVTFVYCEPPQGLFSSSSPF